MMPTLWSQVIEMFHNSHTAEMQQLRWILNVIAPLFCGLLIYFLFRHDTYLNFDHLHWWVAPSKKLETGNYFFNFVLPDFLWVYSSCFAMKLLWNHCEWTEKWTWMSIPLALAFLLEMTIGTFDVLDLEAYFVAAVLVFLADLSEVR